jgi:TM2 domain-containing membrane protein YozV
MHRCIVPLIFAILIPSAVLSQKSKDTGVLNDTVKVKDHSPGKAALFSAIVPGLGQLYNKKYWKIPVVYAGYGVLAYFLVTNTNNYMTYQCAYIEKVNGNTAGNYADLVNRYTEDQLLSAREYYRRNLEISILLTAVWYSLTILDAAVDAHLKTFDISKDLSMRVGPAAIPLPDTPRPGAGICLSLKF